MDETTSVLLVYGDQTGWERLLVNAVIRSCDSDCYTVRTILLDDFRFHLLDSVRILILIISVLPFGRQLSSYPSFLNELEKADTLRNVFHNTRYCLYSIGSESYSSGFSAMSRLENAFSV
ncbi:hypothetical protein WA171_001440, partial [Blastocystis sp. BT1]